MEYRGVYRGCVHACVRCCVGSMEVWVWCGCEYVYMICMCMECVCVRDVLMGCIYVCTHMWCVCVLTHAYVCKLLKSPDSACQGLACIAGRCWGFLP